MARRSVTQFPSSTRQALFDLDRVKHCEPRPSADRAAFASPRPMGPFRNARRELPRGRPAGGAARSVFAHEQNNDEDFHEK